jgi:uncharacterized membrane protein YvlD (DUF360 family)
VSSMPYVPKVPRPKIRPLRLLASWIVWAFALLFAAAVLPGIVIHTFGEALVAAALIALLNSLLPPLFAAIRLPFTLVLGFLLVLVLDALIFLLASHLRPEAIEVDSFWSALFAAFVASAFMVALDPVVPTNDDETYMLRTTQRIARRTGGQIRSTEPGIVFLEIDGLALPVLRRAIRDGNAPEMARWLAEDDYALTEWETDLSSQTGASQAGILLGSNEDIPAFRWVEKETGRTMTCSNPDDCAEIERRRSTGVGLLRDGGASRGNLLSGEADEQILTVSRIEAEKRANPGYRGFFANGFNVTRLLVLFFYEVFLEWTAAIRAARRDVRPRGHRGGKYPFLRATMCVIVRDLIVYGVISDMMKGRPAVYATFSSYDEVAHHSGVERADTLEALRKLDQQFGRIARARPYSPRPYELVVLSDHGQTQGATFLQRNGYSLAELVNRSLSTGTAAAVGGGDENDAVVGNAVQDATGGSGGGGAEASHTPGDEAAVLASGNLGLVYLPDESRRLTLEEIDERHPQLIPALREHPHIGFVLVHSSEHGPVALGARGANYVAEDRIVGEDPLAHFTANAPAHLRRTDGFPHAPDILVNSFYEAQMDEGCAFEELISFHGGLGGPQTRPFILHPAALPSPEEPIVGAAAVHGLLAGWRAQLQATPDVVAESELAEIAPS